MSIRKNTLWNLLGSIAPIMIGIPAIPYIYHNVGIERIGVLTIVWALIGYFSIFDFGLGRAITQRIASLSVRHTHRQQKIIATTGVVITFLIGTVGGLIGLALIEFVGFSWMKADLSLGQEIRMAFLLACFALPATTTTAGLRGILEGELRFRTVNLLKLALGISNFLGPTAAIAYFGPSLNYLVGALVVARYVILVAYIFSARNSIGTLSGNFRFKQCKNLLKFGGWMTLSNIISPLMVVADRILIANLLGSATLAFYTIPADFMTRLLVLPSAITTALLPVFAVNLSEKDFTKAAVLYEKSIKGVFLMMGSITLFILVCARFATEIWLGPEFAEKSSLITSVLAVGVFFNSMAQVPHTYIQASGEARSTACIHVIELIVYFPILLLLIKLHGLLGASIAWTFRTLLDLVLLHARSLQLNK